MMLKILILLFIFTFEGRTVPFQLQTKDILQTQSCLPYNRTNVPKTTNQIPPNSSHVVRRTKRRAEAVRAGREKVKAIKGWNKRTVIKILSDPSTDKFEENIYIYVEGPKRNSKYFHWLLDEMSWRKEYSILLRIILTFKQRLDTLRWSFGKT